MFDKARVKTTPISPQGLIIHLEASRQESYPGTGTLWKDLSTMANNGTLLGDPPIFTPADGGAFVFNGANQRVQITNPVLADQMTVSAWVKMDASNITMAGSSVIENGSAASARLRLMFYGTSFGLAIQTVNNGWYSPGTAINSSTNQAGKWCNVVATYAPGALRLYVNAVLESSSNNVTGNLREYPDYQTYIGYSPAPNLNFGKGAFGGVSIYNRALSAPDVGYNFVSQAARFGLASRGEIGYKYVTLS